MKHSPLACVAFLLVFRPAAGQEDGDRAIRQYLAGHAAALEKEFLPGVKSAADFERLRPALREQYFHSLGLWPLPEKTPLRSATTGTLEFPDFTVEKVHFQSRPGLYVTANLYLPRPARGPYPAVVYACGHSNMKRDGNKTAYQDQGIWLATHGYVALVTDTLQLGEIAAIHHGTYREERWWWHSAGYTSAGVECWNGIRAIDYLETRPEVDKTRIGASGISGGGAATFWLAAADERIKVAIPVSGMADLGYYVGQDGVNGHCDCMFSYNTFRWNWTTIAGLVCPRPLLFANSDHDTIFPMSANERVINRLERLYAQYGESDRVDAMVSIGGHAYRTDLRRAAFEFLNRHLKGDSRRVEDADAGLAEGHPKTRRIAPEQLRVFPKDSDIPADQINTRVDETFVPLASRDLPREFEPWKKARLEELRRVSFGAWPAAAPASSAALEPAVATEVTEDGIQVGRRWIPGKSPGRWLVVLGPDEPAELPEWARPVIGEDSALLVLPRRGWTRKNPPNTVERSMVLLGMTADSGRVWDVMTVARRHGKWRVLGRGAAGLIGAYAALFEPSIEGVTVVDPPASHRAGPHFLNVLRVWDAPDALGALAPRPLSIVGSKDPAFDRTSALYGLAGVADKLERR